MQQLSLGLCCSSTQQKFSSMPWLSLGVHGIASEPFRSGQIARLAEQSAPAAAGSTEQ